MKYSCLIVLLSMLINNTLLAQISEEFDLHTQEEASQIYTNTLYTHIQFLDSRPILQQQHLPINESQFSANLNQLVNAPDSAPATWLVIQLIGLDTYHDKAKGGFVTSIQADLFERINNDYYFINNLDTTISSPDDKTNITDILHLISDYVAANLSSNYTDNQPYTLADIHDIDKNQKLKMPLYRNSVLTDGIYNTYTSFSRQEPLASEVNVKMKKGQLKEIKTRETDSNKWTTVNPQHIYAVVIDGQAFVVFDKKYLPLYRENDDFWFENLYEQSNLSVVPSGGISFGSGGYRAGGIGLHFQKNKKKLKDIYKIDHQTGKAVKTISLEPDA